MSDSAERNFARKRKNECAIIRRRKFDWVSERRKIKRESVKRERERRWCENFAWTLEVGPFGKWGA